MRRLVIVILSFLAGLILLLPYKTIFTYTTDMLISRYSIPMNYQIDNAFLFNAKYSRLQIDLRNSSVSIPDVNVNINPIRYLFKRTLCRIKTEGLQAEVKKLKDVYTIDLKLENFKNSSFKDILLKGTVHFELEGKKKQSGILMVDLKDLKIPVTGSILTLKRVSGKGRFHKGRITVEELRIDGPPDLEVTGFIIPNIRNLENSTVNLDVTIKSNGNKIRQKVKGQLRNLLQFVKMK